MLNRRLHLLSILSATAVISASQAGCRFCLLEGTLVTTPDGPMPIEQLSVDAEVICISSSGQEVVGKVVSRRDAVTNAYLEFVLEGHDENLRITDAQPVATIDAWCAARRIKVGDVLQTRSGLRRVAAIRRHTGYARVHEIGVVPHSNFFANGVLVHNKSVPTPATHEDIVGVWIGWLYHHWGTMYRLDLRPDGTGFCACANSTEPGHWHMYQISRWTLHDGKLKCALRQVEPRMHHVPLKLEGRAYPSQLTLDVNEEVSPGKWERYRGLRMEREADFAAELQRRLRCVGQLRQRMAEYYSGGMWDSPCQSAVPNKMESPGESSAQ